MRILYDDRGRRQPCQCGECSPRRLSPSVDIQPTALIAVLEYMAGRTCKDCERGPGCANSINPLMKIRNLHFGRARGRAREGTELPSVADWLSATQIKFRVRQGPRRGPLGPLQELNADMIRLTTLQFAEISLALGRMEFEELRNA